MGGVFTRMSGRSIAAVFNPTSLFVSVAGGWWDPSDLSTMFKDTAGTIPVTSNNDPVARINDKSGNGNHFVQLVTSSAYPLYKTSGGLSWLEMDGSDDRIGLALASFGTTYDRVSAIRKLTTSFGQIYGASVQFFQNGTATTMYNGTSNGPSVSLSAGTDVVLTERWANPAPCQLAADNAAYVNTPSIAAIAPGSMYIGAAPNGAQACNMRFHGGLIINRALTGPEIANCRTFFGAKQGRVL